jgi:hypothetical protein
MLSANTGMTNSTLSFSELEERIRVIPDGPASVLNTPSWIFAWNALGTVGLALGLLPSLLIKLMDPQMWMVDMARAGVWVAGIGFFPGFVRNIWVVARSMSRWRTEQPEQLDHDLVHFRTLAHELAKRPESLLSEHLRFTQAVHSRLTSKLVFLAGGLDKLGILPILFALGVLLKAYDDLAAIPFWQAVVGLFVVVTYLIAMMGALMRLRLQLYEAVLTQALEVRQAG